MLPQRWLAVTRRSGKRPAAATGYGKVNVVLRITSHACVGNVMVTDTKARFTKD